MYFLLRITLSYRCLLKVNKKRFKNELKKQIFELKILKMKKRNSKAIINIILL